MLKKSLIFGLFLLFSCFGGATDFDEAPISYSATEPANPVSELQTALADGRVSLDFKPQFGYLESVLQQFNILPESQMLVFSKTSFQNHRISPSTPRAIYFNDEVYIGTVQGGDVIEVSVSDPNLGAVFYTLEQKESPKPKFVRQDFNCLQCHASTLTRGYPGHVVRSVFPDAQGFPILRAGTTTTTQASPFQERWGGWYVTGTHGAMRHMGNEIASETENDAVLDKEAGANRESLHERVNPEKYLTPHSDIVALMVLEHQSAMHNLITQANIETRLALHRQADMNAILNLNKGELSDSTRSIIRNIGDKLVDYMLFVDEVELDDPIQGTSGFAESFAKRGPADAEGHSLRDFDLENRLFEFPLSYLIYSEQFDGLAEPMKAYIYQRLWDILSGKISTSQYNHLSNYKCRIIRQILLETKPGLPAYWRN